MSKKSDILIKFEIITNQTNDLLRKYNKKEFLELVCHDDNCFDLYKICKNGEKKCLRLSYSAWDLSYFLEGFNMQFDFE